MFNTKPFQTISMAGRIACGILCAENYAKAMYPHKDWSPLFEITWSITSSASWDDWADRYIEVIPEYLFEFDSYEASDFEYLTKPDYETLVALQKNTSTDWNAILKKIYEIEELYAYSTIPNHGKESLVLLEEIASILSKASVELPPINTVSFSHFSERNGWGNPFDGRKLSSICLVDIN